MATGVTILGLALTAIGSLGTLVGVIWLSAIRSGYESPRRYGPLTIRQVVILTAAAPPLAVCPSPCTLIPLTASGPLRFGLAST